MRNSLSVNRISLSLNEKLFVHGASGKAFTLFFICKINKVGDGGPACLKNPNVGVSFLVVEREKRESSFKGSPYRRQDLEAGGGSRSGGFDDDAVEASSGPFDIGSTKHIPIERWRVCSLLHLSLSLYFSLCSVFQPSWNLNLICMVSITVSNGRRRSEEEGKAYVTGGTVDS